MAKKRYQRTLFAFCRFAYCWRCARLGHPKAYDYFLHFPDRHSVHACKKENTLPIVRQIAPTCSEKVAGLTPHLFLMDGGGVINHENGGFAGFGTRVKSLCVMNGCGISLIESKSITGQFKTYEIKEHFLKISVLTHDNLKALMEFKDSGYEFITIKNMD